MPPKKRKVRKREPAGPTPLELAMDELTGTRNELYGERLLAAQAQEQANIIRRQWDLAKPALEAEAQAASTEADSLREELALALRARDTHERRTQELLAEVGVLVQENRHLSRRCTELAVGHADAERRVEEAKAQAEEEVTMAQRALEGAFGAAVTEAAEEARRVREGTATMRHVRHLERQLAASQAEVAKLTGSQEAVVSRCEAAMRADRASRMERDIAMEQRDLMQRQLSELALAVNALEATGGGLRTEGDAIGTGGARPGGLAASEAKDGSERGPRGSLVLPGSPLPSSPSFRIKAILSAVQASVRLGRSPSAQSLVSGVTSARSPSPDDLDTPAGAPARWVPAASAGRSPLSSRFAASPRLAGPRPSAADSIGAAPDLADRTSQGHGASVPGPLDATSSRSSSLGSAAGVAGRGGSLGLDTPRSHGRTSPPTMAPTTASRATASRGRLPSQSDPALAAAAEIPGLSRVIAGLAGAGHSGAALDRAGRSPALPATTAGEQRRRAGGAAATPSRGPKRRGASPGARGGPSRPGVLPPRLHTVAEPDVSSATGSGQLPTLVTVSAGLGNDAPGAPGADGHRPGSAARQRPGSARPGSAKPRASASRFPPRPSTAKPLRADASRRPQSASRSGEHATGDGPGASGSRPSSAQPGRRGSDTGSMLGGAGGASAGQLRVRDVPLVVPKPGEGRRARPASASGARRRPATASSSASRPLFSGRGPGYQPHGVLAWEDLERAPAVTLVGRPAVADTPTSASSGGLGGRPASAGFGGRPTSAGRWSMGRGSLKTGRPGLVPAKGWPNP